MRFLLFILAFLAAISGAAVLVGAKSAIHESEAFILFLIAAVFLTGAGTIEAINSLKLELRKSRSSLSRD